MAHYRRPDEGAQPARGTAPPAGTPLQELAREVDDALKLFLREGVSDMGITPAMKAIVNNDPAEKIFGFISLARCLSPGADEVLEDAELERITNALLHAASLIGT